MIIFGYNIKFLDDKTVSRGRVKAQNMNDATTQVQKIINGRATNTNIKMLKNQELALKQWEQESSDVTA